MMIGQWGPIRLDWTHSFPPHVVSGGMVIEFHLCLKQWIPLIENLIAKDVVVIFGERLNLDSLGVIRYCPIQTAVQIKKKKTMN